MAAPRMINSFAPRPASGREPARIYWVVTDPSPSHAGLRIRVQPSVAALVRRGVPAEVISQADLAQRLDEVAANARAVVLAKPNDSVSQLLLQALLARQVPVAVDVFDNYLGWSPGTEARQLHWHWLRSLRDASLVIAGTPYLEGVIRTLRDGPTVLLPDPLPVPLLDEAQSQAVREKWPLGGRLELLWFGLAANPFFHAGLESLHESLPRLVALRERLDTACELQLTICSNRGPAVEAVLAALRRHGLAGRFIDWSETVCADLLARSHGVLLPSNLSGFSVSKGHNRCSDALLRDTLVLASPNGPYPALDGGAVLHSVDALAATIRAVQAGEADVHALAQRSLAGLSAAIGHEAATDRLLAALAACTPASRAADGPGPQRMPGGPPQRPPRSAPARCAEPAAPRVLIALRARPEAVQLAQSLGWLSLGFADNGPHAAHDFTIALPPRHEHGVLAMLALSPAGWAATLAAMERSLAFDGVETDVALTGQADGWQVHFDKASRTATLLAEPDAALREALATLPLLPSPLTHAAERWCGTLIALGIGWLRRLGFDRFDLADDEGGGWPAFSEHGDPALALREARLRALWARYRGREHLWGDVTEPMARIDNPHAGAVAP
ncbi:hypothetical protein [Aquabacterium sp.]|uniref:hypothetical protein n=1 Tax=Aquabacterium sp. TaxID=1872578 RepID=UPI002C881EA5|nr:hypothetical protein [Aquabacterium sp.]HSW07418.1 hypothetical protein [Aquabacterium sp.]